MNFIEDDAPQHSHQDETHVWRKVMRLEKETYCGPVYNLSVEGDESYVAEGVGVHNCVSFSLGAAYRYMRRKRHGWPVPAHWGQSNRFDGTREVPTGGVEDFDISFQLLYWEARKAEGTQTQDAGCVPRDAIKFLKTGGAAAWHNYPYVSGKFAEVPPALAITNASNHKISAYHAIPVGNLTQIKQALVLGIPVMIGMGITDTFVTEFDYPETYHGLISTPDHTLLGFADGHALLIVGYRDADKRFIVRNSWGVRGGIDGHVLMPYDYIADPAWVAEIWTIDVGAS